MIQKKTAFSGLFLLGNFIKNELINQTEKDKNWSDLLLALLKFSIRKGRQDK